MSYGGDAYGTLAYGEGAEAAVAAPPYNLVMVVADAAHGATTHVRHMLEVDGGHTVTVLLDTTTADLTIYDAILVVRGSAPAAVITAWDAGVPVVFGSGAGLTAGSGQSMSSTTHNLTGTWSVTSSVDKRYQIEVTDASHYITSPLNLGARYLYGLDTWRFGLDAAAAYVGTALVEGDPADATAGGITLVAVEQGTERLNAAGPTPARAVVFGDLYAGQDVYDAFGYQLLERSLHWCLGYEAVTEVPVTSWSTSSPDSGLLSSYTGGRAGNRLTADAAIRIGSLHLYTRLANTLYTLSIWDHLDRRVMSRTIMNGGTAQNWVRLMLPRWFEVKAGESFSVVIDSGTNAIYRADVSDITFGTDVPMTYQEGRSDGTAPLGYPPTITTPSYYGIAGVGIEGVAAPQTITAPFIDSTAEVFAPSRVGQPYPVAVELTATDYTQAVDLESQTFGFKFTPTENITIKGFSAHMPAENGTNGINVEVRLWQAGPTLLHTAAIHAPGGSWPGQQWGKSDPVSIELTAGTTYAVAVTGVGGTGYYGYQGGAFRASVDARVGLISWSYGDSLTAYPATNYPSPYILGITGFSFEPALASAQAITTPFVSSTSEVYALGVAPEQAVTSAFIASAEAIYAPTVAIASAALEYGIDTLPVLNTASEFGWTMGYAFTTTKVLTVQEVRVYVGTTGVHHVALWDAAGTKLAGVDVTVSLTGQWEQFEFPDVELAADAQYTISVFRSDTSIYHWSSDAPTVNPDIVYNGGRWTWAGNADAFPNSSDPTQLYGVADIAYLDVAAPPAAQDVSPGFIGSDAAIYAPTVVRIAPQDVTAPFITSSAEMYAPTVALEVPPEVATPFIDSAEEHYTATLVRQGAQDVLAPFISSTVEVFPTAIGAALFRVWDGSAYVEGQGQVWTEGGWALIKARHHYDGSSWVKV